MKKTGILMLLVLFIGTTVIAQSSKDARMQKAKAKSEELAKELNLTEEQIQQKAEIDAEMYAQFEEIQLERKAIMEQRQQINENSSAEDREALSIKMEAVRNKQLEIKKNAHDQFLSILNKEQKTAYEKMTTPKSVKLPMESDKHK